MRSYLCLFFVLFISAEVMAQNLVVNGDFESGNTGFSSDYEYKPGGNTDKGQYNVLSDPSTWHPLFLGQDHTTGSGLFMALNGDDNSSSRVWWQSISVVPETNYQFGLWLSTLYPENPAKLQISINNISIGEILAPSSTDIWIPCSFSWDSDSHDTAVIEIRDLSTELTGNDFGLDDIYFVSSNSTSTVVGKILFDDGTPIPGTGSSSGNVFVQAKFPDETHFTPAVGVDENGFFVLPLEEPGEYELFAKLSYTDWDGTIHTAKAYNTELIAGVKRIRRTLSSPGPQFQYANIEFPNPVVLVHGFGGGADTWTQAQETLRTSPDEGMPWDIQKEKEDYYGLREHITFVAPNFIDLPVFGLNPLGGHTANAIKLRIYIVNIVLAANSWLQNPKCPKFNFVGHSMGGIILRKYFDLYDGEEGATPSKFILAGTPNGGWNRFDLTWPFMPFPAAYQLTTTYMTIFNLTTADPPSSFEDTWLFAGTIADPGVDPIWYLWWPGEGFPNDQVVGRHSVFTAVDGKHTEYPVNHDHLKRYDAGSLLPPFFQDEEPILRILKILEGIPVPTSLDAPTVCNFDQDQPELVETATLIGGGGPINWHLNVEGIGSSSTITIQWVEGDGAVEVIDPGSGLPIDPDTHPDVTREYFSAECGGGEIWDFNDLSSGLYPVNVYPGSSTPTQGTPAIMLVQYTGSLEAIAWSSTESGLINVPMTMYASFLENGSPYGGSFTWTSATVTAPDSTETTLSLTDPGGTGTYEASFTPILRGTHFLEVEATTTSGFIRQAVASFSVGGSMATAGNFTENAVDTDNDTLINVLYINGEVTVAAADEFQIAGTLRNISGTDVGLATASVDATGGAGTYPFELSWTNEDLLATGEDGPWYLEDLRVFDVTTDLSLEFEDASAFGPTTVTLLDEFDPLPPPSPDSISPNFGSWGGGTIVTITGEAVGLDPNVSVHFGNMVSESVTVISENMISVEVPPCKPTRGKSPGVNAVMGVPQEELKKTTVDVTVSNVNGTGVLIGGWTYYFKL